MMGHVKRFAIGAGLVAGAVYLDKMLRDASVKPDATFKADSFVVKYGAPIAGGGIFVAAHALGVL